MLYKQIDDRLFVELDDINRYGPEYVHRVDFGISFQTYKLIYCLIISLWPAQPLIDVLELLRPGAADALLQEGREYAVKEL